MSDAVERAALLLEAGRVRAARELIARRLAEAPDDLEALGLAAWAAELEDDHEEALRLVARPLAADPDDVQLLAVVAWARAGTGDPIGARNAAARRVELSPGDWGALADLAGVDLQSGRHGSDTLAAAQEAVRLAPGEPGAHLRLGSVHLARGEHVPARAQLEQVLAVEPDNLEARHDLAVARLQAGDPIGSAREFARLSIDGRLAPLAVHNIALAATRVLWVVQLNLFVCANVAVFGVGAGPALLDGGGARLLAAVLAAVVPGAFVLSWFVRLRETAPNVIRLLSRTSRGVAIWAVLLLVSVPLIAVGAALPPLVATWVYDAARLLTVGGFVAGALVTAALRRSAA